MKTTNAPVKLSLFAVGLIVSGCGLLDSDVTYTLTITENPETGGTVSPASGSFNEGEVVTLEAEPTEGWRFVGWEGEWSSGENPLELTMSRDYTISAVFERRKYPLEMTVEGEGKVREEVVQAKSTDYPYETMVQLTAEPEEGWQFDRWEGDVEGNENPVTIDMDEEKTVTAIFVRREYSLEMTVEGEGMVQEEIVQAKSTDYPYETMVQLTAEPAEGWQFDRWEGDVEGNENPATIAIDGEKMISAVFTLTTVTDIDGNIYRTAVIGNQEWMAENLRVTRYGDGSHITTGLSENSWSAYNSGAFAIYPHTVSNADGINSDEEMVDAYGLLYNGFALDNWRGLCPAEWRVPTGQDWMDLTTHVIETFDLDDDQAGNKLKSCRQSESPLGGDCATEEHPRWNFSETEFGTNESGFSGLPGGYRTSKGIYTDLGTGGYWWSGTEIHQNDAWIQRIHSYHSDIFSGQRDKHNGYSVRCVRDK